MLESYRRQVPNVTSEACLGASPFPTERLRYTDSSALPSKGADALVAKAVSIAAQSGMPEACPALRSGPAATKRPDVARRREDLRVGLLFEQPLLAASDDLWI